jgi:hypothetical protein
MGKVPLEGGRCRVTGLPVARVDAVQSRDCERGNIGAWTRFGNRLHVLVARSADLEACSAHPGIGWLSGHTGCESVKRFNAGISADILATRDYAFCRWR